VVRLFAVLSGLLGVVLVPLALTLGTAIVLLPSHFLFAVLCTAGSLVAAGGGRSFAPRAFGGWFLLCSLAAAVALDLGSRVGPFAYWWLAWTPALVWSWVPPLVAALAAEIGRFLGSTRSRRAVRRRKRQKLAQPAPNSET
jgi:hypothetical protein